MNIYLLQIKFLFHETENIIFPVIISNHQHSILVDCGYEGFLPLLEDAALKAGFPFYRLTGVLITHHDIDHIGGLFEIKEKYPGLKIFAWEPEAKYISGQEKSVRLIQAEAIYNSLPEDQKAGALYFQEQLRQIKPVYVDKVFTLDADAYIMEGVKILHTPGHMPWHISLYVEESKTLIAGDALVVEDDGLDIANPAFTLNMEQALTSLKKIREMDIEQIICYHGGLVISDIKNKLDRLIYRYTSA